MTVTLTGYRLCCTLHSCHFDCAHSMLGMRSHSGFESRGTFRLRSEKDSFGTLNNAMFLDSTMHRGDLAETGQGVTPQPRFLLHLESRLREERGPPTPRQGSLGVVLTSRPRFLPHLRSKLREERAPSASRQRSLSITGEGGHLNKGRPGSRRSGRRSGGTCYRSSNRWPSSQPSKPLGLHHPSHRLPGTPRDNDSYTMRLSPRWQQKRSPRWTLHHPRIRELRYHTHLLSHFPYQTAMIAQTDWKNRPTAHLAPPPWRARRRHWTCRARQHTRGRMSMNSCVPRWRDSTTQLVLGPGETDKAPSSQQSKMFGSPHSVSLLNIFIPNVFP